MDKLYIMDSLYIMDRKHPLNSALNDIAAFDETPLNENKYICD